MSLLQSLRSSRFLVLTGLLAMLALFGLDRSAWAAAAVPLLLIFLPLLIIRRARGSLEDLLGKRR